jgi:hypothetical protein
MNLSCLHTPGLGASLRTFGLRTQTDSDVSQRSKEVPKTLMSLAPGSGIGRRNRNRAPFESARHPPSGPALSRRHIKACATPSGSESGVTREQFQKLLEGEYLASTKGECGEQAVFGWLQVDGFPVNRDLPMNEVDTERAVVEGVKGFSVATSLGLPLWSQGCPRSPGLGATLRHHGAAV